MVTTKRARSRFVFPTVTRSFFRCGLLATGVALVAGSAYAEVGTELVIATTEDAPGIEGAKLTSFVHYYLAGDGGLVVEAATDAATSVGRMGVFAASDAGFELVLADGDAIPESDMGTYQISSSTRFEGPFVDEKGKMSLLLGATKEDYTEAVLSGTPGDFDTLATAAYSVIEEPDAVMALHDLRPGLDDAVAFLAETAGDTASISVMLAAGGKARAVARTGDPAPGFDHQFFDYTRGFTPFDVNAAGRVAFLGTRTGANDDERRAIWSATSADDLRLELAFSDLATAMSLPSVDNAYLVLSQDEKGVVAAASGGFWRANEGKISPLRVAPEHTTFFGYSENTVPVFSPSGEKIAFTAETLYSDGAERKCEGITLWTGSYDHPVAIARSGLALRGAPDVTFVGVGWMQINEAGQLALELEVQRASDGKDRSQLYRYSAEHGFELVVAPDSLVDDGKTERAVTSFDLDCEVPNYVLNGGLAYNFAEAHSCFDEAGRVAFRAKFADGTTGLVLSDPLGSKGESPPLQAELAQCDEAGVGTGTGDGSGGAPTGGAGATSAEGGAAGADDHGDSGANSAGRGGSGGGSPGTGGARAGSGGAGTSSGGRQSQPEAGSGATPANTGSSDDSGGCGCRIGGAAERQHRTAWLLIVGALGAALVGRRRGASSR